MDIRINVEGGYMGQLFDKLGRAVSKAQFNKRVAQLSKEQEKKENKENDKRSNRYDGEGKLGVIKGHINKVEIILEKET